jgi:hypothetical protein
MPPTNPDKLITVKRMPFEAEQCTSFLNYMRAGGWTFASPPMLIGNDVVYHLWHDHPEAGKPTTE